MRLLKRLLPFDALYDTCRRFPLPVLCAVLLYGLIIYEDVRFDRVFTTNIAVMLTAAFFWLGGIRLTAEKMRWSIFRQAGVACAGVACLYLSFFVIGDYEQNYFIVICALLLFLMFAPYVGGGDDTSFWFYNRTLWFGVVVSYLALMLFAGSVSLAFYAIDELFNIHISGKLYGYIWSFAAVVLGPVYALSWVPKTFEFTKEDCDDPPGLKFLIDWIVVPVGFFYLAILYAYFGKIIITQEIPKNQLVWLITGFISSGIVTYLIAWPMRNEGSLQVRTFYKVFFPAMVVPIGFLAYAIWVRIDDYGLTEQRYLVVMAILWFAFLAVSNSLVRTPIKVLPMTLVPLLLFVSVGSWSYYKLPQKDQYNRLVILLEENNLLVDGEIKAVNSPSDVSIENRISITNIIKYLCRRQNKEILLGLFDEGDAGKGLSCYGKGDDVYSQLGFPATNNYSRTRQDDNPFERLYFTADASDVHKVSGYEFFVPNMTARFNKNAKYKFTKNNKWVVGVEMQLKTALSEGGMLEIYNDNDLLFKIDISKAAETFFENRDHKALFIFDGAAGRFKYRVKLKSFSADYSKDDVTFKNVGFHFLFSAPDFKGNAKESGIYE